MHIDKPLKPRSRSWLRLATASMIASADVSVTDAAAKIRADIGTLANSSSAASVKHGKSWLRLATIDLRSSLVVGAFDRILGETVLRDVIPYVLSSVR
jgi:hypothetical protein